MVETGNVSNLFRLQCMSSKLQVEHGFYGESPTWAGKDWNLQFGLGKTETLKSRLLVIAELQSGPTLE